MIQAAIHGQEHGQQFLFTKNISHSYHITLFHALYHRRTSFDSLNSLEGGCSIN